MQGTIFESWFAAEIAELYNTPPVPAQGTLFGMPVWGRRYVERLNRYCLASLMSPQNLAALRDMGARFLFYTDDVLALWRQTAFLEHVGLPVQIRKIPTEVLEAAESIAKYLVLGVVQNVCVQQAARSGQGFYMLLPDILYSGGYFEALRRLSGEHEAIVQNAPGMDIDAAAADIEALRQPGGTLAIGDVELGDLFWKHMHPAWRTVLASEKGFRHFNFVTWRARDGLHMASPYMAPVWISPRLCRAATVTAPAPVDAEAPAFVGDKWYMPGPNEGMTFIELSDASKPLPVATDLEGFLDTWWRQMHFENAYLPFAEKRCVVPMSPVDDAMADADIEKMHAEIIQVLKAHKFRAMEKHLTGIGRRSRRMVRGYRQFI